MARARRMVARAEYWPSFVDVLTNLLLVFIFLLSIFALVQFLLSREISGRDTALQRLNAQIAQLTELLAMEKAKNSDATDNLATLQASLTAAQSERDRLRGLLEFAEQRLIVGQHADCGAERRSRKRETG